MSILLTPNNVQAVYNSSPGVLRELLPQVFEQLKKPKVGRRFAESYVVSLRLHPLACLLQLFL